MSRRTQDPARLPDHFDYRTCTFFGRAFNRVRLCSFLSSRGPSTPVLRPVWASPLSLAATWGITVVFFSSGYLDVSVHRVPPCTAMCSPCGDRLCAGRVPPFGDRRVFASLQLTAAFRSLARPSSVSSGKASSVRPSLLNQWFSTFSCFFRDVSKKTVITVSVSSYNFYVIDLFCYVFSFDVVQFSKIDPEVSKQIPQNQTEYLQVQNLFLLIHSFSLERR